MFPEKIHVDGRVVAARNALGRPIHPSLEGVSNFQRWFAGSRAVDEVGRPLVVFHGTNKDLIQFSTQRPAWFAAVPELANQFTAGGRRNGGAKPRKGSAVYPVYLVLKNPLDLSDYRPDSRLSEIALRELIGAPTDRASVEADIRRELASGARKVSPTLGDPVDYCFESMNHPRDLFVHLDNPRVIGLMRAAGYDGIKMQEVMETGSTHAPVLVASATYAAFDASQIKSALGNSGAFDMAVPALADTQVSPLPAWSPVAFHGTGSEISRFTLDHGDPDEAGIFLSSDSRQASGYGPCLVQALLHPTLPCVVSYQDWQWGDLPEPDALREQGVDLIMITNFDVGHEERGPSGFCVLVPDIITIEHQSLPAHRSETRPATAEPVIDLDAPARFLVASFRPETAAFSGEMLAPSLARLAGGLLPAFDAPLSLRDINGAVVGEARMMEAVVNASPHEYQLVLSADSPSLRAAQVAALSEAFSQGLFGSRLVTCKEHGIAAAIHAPDWACTIERLAAYGAEVRPLWHLEGEKPTFSVTEEGVTRQVMCDDPYEAWRLVQSVEHAAEQSIPI